MSRERASHARRARLCGHFFISFIHPSISVDARATARRAGDDERAISAVGVRRGVARGVRRARAGDDDVIVARRFRGGGARAVHRARVARARTRAPLAIEATAALLETMSRDRDARGGHLETTRAAYAMTLPRLVNGVVDPAQKGRYAAPVATLARKAGLARELVDLRHEATHDAMPGLGALRRGARRARWRGVGGGIGTNRDAFEEAMMGVRKRARELCACEADARALRERQGVGRGAETSDEEEEDARRGRGRVEF